MGRVIGKKIGSGSERSGQSNGESSVAENHAISEVEISSERSQKNRAKSINRFGVISSVKSDESCGGESWVDVISE